MVTNARENFPFIVWEPRPSTGHENGDWKLQYDITLSWHNVRDGSYTVLYIAQITLSYDW